MAGDAERGRAGVAGTGQMQAEAEAASNRETPEGMCRDIKRTGQENPEKIARIYLYSLFNSGNNGNQFQEWGGKVKTPKG